MRRNFHFSFGFKSESNLEKLTVKFKFSCQSIFLYFVYSSVSFFVNYFPPLGSLSFFQGDTGEGCYCCTARLRGRISIQYKTVQIHIEHKTSKSFLVFLAVRSGPEKPPKCTKSSKLVIIFIPAYIIVSSNSKLFLLLS